MPIRALLTKADFFCDPIALISADGTIDTSNRTFADRLGQSPQALTGQRLDALAAASADAIGEYLRTCADSAEVVHGSLKLRNQAEAVEAHGIAYPPEAAPRASHVLLRLATERDREESFWRQSQILEVTLASIGDAVIVTDVHGRTMFMNSVAESLTGYSARESQGRPLADAFRILEERTRTVAEDPVTYVLQTGKAFGLAHHTLLLTRDGREIPIDESAAAIRLPNGELFGVVLIFRDITARRRAAHSHAWLAAIVESSDDAIVSKSLDGHITSWNPGATRLFGYTSEEMIGQPITTIVPSELFDEERQVLARLRRGEHLSHFETIRVAKDGRRIDVSLTVSPVRNDEGEIVGASKIARDLTEHKRARSLLQQVDHRQDEFLAMLAHELRNPLAPMRNAMDLLCRGNQERRESQIACEILDRQLRQMGRLIDDLLDVSRVRAGQLELREERLDLTQLLRGIESGLRPSFETSRQHLLVEMRAEVLHVRGDRTRLTQVFSNILHNANKYTLEGGRIIVRLDTEGDQAVVSIRDTGIGIPPGMLHQIFDLFAQVDRSSPLARGGLGIGLTLAKRLVEAHRGLIEARSEGEGRGSEFIVRLPLIEPLAAMKAGHHATRTRDASRRILIADDHADAAQSLAILLQVMGHRTSIVHDGIAAIEAAEALQPELVILDLDMPRLEGSQAAERIAAQTWAANVYLVALTGREMDDRRVQTARTRFHRVFFKPIEPSDLTVILKEVDRRVGQDDSP